MNYNWQKIFKTKTDQELYQIFTGKSYLDSETEHFAKKELQEREFDFNKIVEYQKLWELEELLKEGKMRKQEELSSSSKTTSFLITGLYGVAYLLIVILGTQLNFDFVKSFNITDYFLHLTLGIIVTTFGFVSYKLRKRRILVRQRRANQLVKEIKTKANKPHSA